MSVYTVDEIVRDLLQQLTDHTEYNYVSVTDLIHKAGIDFDQIDFMDLFHIQNRVESEAKKAGIKLDYSEFDGTTSGVPFNLPAVLIRSDAITGAEFIWQSSGLISSEDICMVRTKVTQNEIQIRRYNSCGLVNGNIYRLCGEPHARLLALLNKGWKEWDKDDYSVFVCDGYYWDLKLLSGRKIVRKLKGTVEPPPMGKEIQSIVYGIAGEDNVYIF